VSIQEVNYFVTRLSVPSQPSSAAVVRRCIADDLGDSGLPEDLLCDVVLVATELLSNALRHAASLPENDLVICWSVDGKSVRLKVTDGGGRHSPHIRYPGPRDTTGRGLSIINSLAAEWGVEEHNESTSVWVTLHAS
jgi:serine/threonine-protein kinase RsbW